MKTNDERRASTRRSTLAWSALGAAAVVFSFLCTLALALACLALPFLAWHLALQGFHYAPALVLFPVFGVVPGLSILWALIPRKITFDPPGVRVDLLQETKLAAEIALIAAAFDQPIPKEIYLIAEASAYVSERRGTWTTGRQKVIALGLPLLATFSVAELRALLAHEFAHFYCGDTRLLPWVNRGRSTMARVYNTLSPDSAMIGILTSFVIVAIPYALLMRAIRFYWLQLMGLTNFISRRQELRSDELACHLAGSPCLTAALQQIHRCHAVTLPYWQSVVFPAVARGYQPQLANTFTRFLATPHIASQASSFLQTVLLKTSSGPLDTHPPLDARIDQAAAFSLLGTHAASANEGATSLLQNLGKLESDLLRFLVPAAKVDQLKPLSWGVPGAEMYLPLWRQQVAPFLPFLSRNKIVALPELARNPKDFADRILVRPGKIMSNRERDDLAASLLSKALTVALVDQGWQLHVHPASSVLQHHDVTLAASSVPNRLRSGELPASEWIAFCTATGIGDYPLGRPAAVV